MNLELSSEWILNIINPVTDSLMNSSIKNLNI